LIELQIKEKLKEGESVRVISTQLIEAGVDIDFPVVYRAIAGLDSIAQSAGRCNREGKLPGLGKVIVFNPPRRAPSGILLKGEETTKSILSSSRVELSDVKVFERYFSMLYWKANSTDSKSIVSLLSKNLFDGDISFRTASRNFRIIDDSNQKTIIVIYGDSKRLLDELRIRGPNRDLLRKLQRYTVNIYNQDFYKLLERGALEEISPGIFSLLSEMEYSDDTGLVTDNVLYNPSDLIV
jgi:CRISPR-associated endonuclease/helicase Cas3